PVADVSGAAGIVAEIVAWILDRSAVAVVAPGHRVAQSVVGQHREAVAVTLLYHQLQLVRLAAGVHGEEQISRAIVWIPGPPRVGVLNRGHWIAASIRPRNESGLVERVVSPQPQGVHAGIRG